MSETKTMFTPLDLPNGEVIKNRLCKAAMEENLSDAGQVPGLRLFNLYQQWASGELGLILTGNVMVAPDALTGPGGVVLQNESDLHPFRQWAKIATANNTHCWMQINHPGRQVYAAMGETAYSPSDLSLEMGGFSKMFAKPTPLNGAQIRRIIERFATTAKLAQDAGFTGVQIHAAHGYLISQFLSPLVNQRTDEWGGCRENRARLLMEVVNEVRARVRPNFCVSVKLNSADFQKGGFDQEDAASVVEKLNEMKVDLVELSGGSYESPAMQGGSEYKGESSSLKREAFFIEFAREIAKVAKMPLMVTGGILNRQVAENALAKDEAGFGVEMLGIARGLAFEPHLAKIWRDTEHNIALPKVEWKNRVLASLAVMAVTKLQLNRMSQGLPVNASINPLGALIKDRFMTKIRTRRYRKWRAATAAQNNF